MKPIDSKDIVFIKQCKISTTIGVYPHEKVIQQPLFIDLEMAADTSRAAASDDLQHAIDYEAVQNLLTTTLAENQYQLIETVAETIANLLIDQFQLPWVKVTVNKPQALKDCANVGVTIERQPTA